MFFRAPVQEYLLEYLKEMSGSVLDLTLSSNDGGVVRTNRALLAAITPDDIKNLIDESFFVDVSFDVIALVFSFINSSQSIPFGVATLVEVFELLKMLQLPLIVQVVQEIGVQEQGCILFPPFLYFHCWFSNFLHQNVAFMFRIRDIFQFFVF